MKALEKERMGDHDLYWNGEKNIINSPGGSLLAKKHTCWDVVDESHLNGSDCYDILWQPVVSMLNLYSVFCSWIGF